MPIKINGLRADQSIIWIASLLPEPPADPNAWRELATAYHLHHFACPICIAAGRGAGYGLRCGTGAALWKAYQNT